MKIIKSMTQINQGVGYLTARHPKLLIAHQTIIENQFTVPLRLRNAGFIDLVEIIIAQQVSKQSASAITGRLHQHFTSPSPEVLCKASDEDWRIVGLSRPKIKTVRALSVALIGESLNLENLGRLDAESAIKSLCAIHGIGPWTAQIYLMFCLGHADIFPAGDVALQDAISRLFNIKPRANPKQTKQISDQWSPWRGVAARILWSYYACYKNKDGVIP